MQKLYFFDTYFPWIFYSGYYGSVHGNRVFEMAVKLTSVRSAVLLLPKMLTCLVICFLSTIDVVIILQYR